MATGARPRLFRDNYGEEGGRWGCEVAQGRSARHFPELKVITTTPSGTPLDPRLLHVWADLREFSRIANGVTTPTTTTTTKTKTTATRMPINVFSKVGSSIPYRLVQLEFPPASLEEVLRLSMLAYAKTLVMRLKGFMTRLGFLANKVKPAIQAQLLLAQQGLAGRDSHDDGRNGQEEGQNTGRFLRFLLWAVFIVTVSLCEDNIGHDNDDDDDDTQNWCKKCLIQILTMLSFRTWAEVKATLSQFLWVDVLHDHPARAIFERAQREMLV